MGKEIFVPKIIGKRKYTPENITPENAGPNGIFVFGSNTEGRHGKGAALTARQYFGAIYGQAKGPQGTSYAIITKDLKKGMRSVSLESITEQIKELILYAMEKTDLIFYVTKLGSSLAGFTIKEIKNCFELANEYYEWMIPDNIVLPIEYEWRCEDLYDLTETELSPEAEEILNMTMLNQAKENSTKLNRK